MAEYKEKIGMTDYALMHMERHIATVQRDGSCTVYFPRFMPYSLRLEDADAASDPAVRRKNLEQFFFWCSHRPLTLGREGAKDFLASHGLAQAATDRELAEIALCCHGLNLTDVFWIRELGESVSYARINLFDHPRSGEGVDVGLCDRRMIAKNTGLILGDDPSGVLYMQSAAPNIWLRRDGRYELLKGGSPREVQAELVASQIARCFDADQVLYEPAEYQGRCVSRSVSITSKEKSIAAATDMQGYLTKTGKSLRRLIFDRDESGFHMMNIIDYLIGNVDRHGRNWGFMIDNAEHEPEKLFPLMDFNRSFLAYDSIEGDRCYATGGKMSQKEAAVRGVQKIGLNQIGSLPENLPALFQELNALDNTRLDLMFRARLDVLRQAAQG